MNDYIAIIEDNPSRICISLGLNCFVKFGLNFSPYLVGQALQHACTCTAGDNKIIGKRCNAFDIQYYNIFPLLVFQGICNTSCKFNGFQFSPLTIL